MRYEKMLGQDEKPEDRTSAEGGLFYPAPPDKSYKAIEAALKRRFQNYCGCHKFRPALHFLLQDFPKVKIICTYDVDRLSRNNAILKSCVREIAIISPFGHSNLRDEYLLIKLRSGELEIPLCAKMQKNRCPRLSVAKR